MNSRRLADYYPAFRRQTKLWFFAAQISIALIVVAVALGLQTTSAAQIADFLIPVGLFLALELALTPLLVNIFTEPTKILSQAITQLSNQGSDAQAPNLNEPRHEQSGLKLVAQTLYDLVLSGPGQSELKNPKTTLGSDFSSQLLGDLPAGVIAIDASHQVIYANSSAPVRLNADMRNEIQLMFPDNSFTDWLQDCAANKLKDVHYWNSIANKSPEHQDRQLFDVIGFYQKSGAAAETILVTLDKTESYAPFEEEIDFIALAAHELRGPITVIRGYLDVLREELGPKLMPEEQELVNRLQVSSNRLSGYINNILNVSRYDRQHLKLHLREDRLSEIIGSVNDDITMRAQTSGRLLSISLPSDLPTVAADRNSLSEVITNLVDNALKYSHEGGQVIISAVVKGNFVEVSVQDFGIGIPASVVSNLFTKFYRSHKSRQAVSGTGLGLYITKAIIQSHGGQVWVRSTEGQGSIFGFSVPVYATVAKKLASANNGNEGIIESSNGWIKNHAMFRN